MTTRARENIPIEYSPTSYSLKFIASLVVNVLCANTKQIWLKFMCMKCISYLRARDH